MTQNRAIGPMSVPRRFQKKQVIAVTAIAVVLVGGGWVATIPGASRVPRSLPASFAFQGVEGSATFQPNRHGRTLVILFHSACAHCANEFDELEAHLDRIDDTRLYLFTTEPALNSHLMSRWPRLRGSDKVIWGVIQPAKRDRYFGVSVTPALFLYDRDGGLLHSWRGETKLDVLLDGGARAAGSACVAPHVESGPCKISSRVSAGEPPPIDIKRQQLQPAR